MHLLRSLHVYAISEVNAYTPVLVYHRGTRLYRVLNGVVEVFYITSQLIKFAMMKRQKRRNLIEITPNSLVSIFMQLIIYINMTFEDNLQFGVILVAFPN